MGDRGSPGPKIFNNSKGLEWDDFIIGLSKKYDVDKEEIFVGESSVPPNDTACLVYVSITPCAMMEYFRKDLLLRERRDDEELLGAVRLSARPVVPCRR